ncbi:hypothetical protein E3O42_09295 [Cryobacterium adonitolivorans]|uniref:Protein kinase domain-containing protein n=1 Tax=Cryobacterium adonitolivorans TaxID=1259189 RepID=A0A4R8W3W5_9MICO|nr:hypothetical protein [Cryobacterium adonitolivorans]TFC01868.1 hypothetical protein E3O42_09295 [Cryobacterium adonitolivorans]
MEHAHMTDLEGTLAGFRLVRRLGTGSRSIVYLGQAAGERGDARTAALKVFRLDADRPALDRQVRAMLTVPPAMLASLRDVATAPDGRLCLVLDRLTGSSLDRLLAERGALGAGEVVTIAATITTALQALHETGFSHSMIGPACVRFDGRGRPVLLGLGALEDLPPGGAGVARRRDDLVRLAGCVRAILDHLDPHVPEAATAQAVLAEFEATATARPVPTDLTGVESVLFAWAPATAVRGAAPGIPPADADGALKLQGPATPRIVLTRPARPTEVRGLPGTGHGRLRGAERRRPANRSGPVGRLVLRWRAGYRSRLQIVHDRSRATAKWRHALLMRALLVRDLLGRALPGRAVPRRAVRAGVVGVCLAVVLAAGGLAALSWADSPAAGPGTTTARPAAEPAAAQGDNGSAGAAGFAGTLEADDPAAATLALLQLREGCLAEASVLCLEGVDQAGSVAMAADSYQARQEAPSAGRLAAQGPLTVGKATVFTATVQERRGNAALIVLTPVAGGPARMQPASALVIKGEAGWRLRELFDY